MATRSSVTLAPVTRMLALAVLLAAFTGCQHSQHHRQVANYDGTPQPTPSADQCALPVAERTGGWVC